MSLKKKLVLVVGAGASKEVGLPVGSSLKEQIAAAFDFKEDDFGRIGSGGDPQILQAIHAMSARGGGIDPYVAAARLIRNAMPQAASIDNFIDSHRANMHIAACAKLAITRCILLAERGSQLMIDPGNIYNRLDFAAVGKTWFNSLWQLLTENCDLPERASRFEHLTIISFNYDRCVEHYLHEAIQNYYGASVEAASSAMDHLQIHHPYGLVGQYRRRGANQGIPFGMASHGPDLIEIAQQIRTFTEGSDPSLSDIDATRSALRGAERIAFLGFAYHRLNLQLLFPAGAQSSHVATREIFGSALGISKSNAELIAGELAKKVGLDVRKVHLERDLACAGLIDEYSRSLSLS